MKSFCDAVLRLGFVTRGTGEIPLTKNKTGRMWLMYMSCTEIVTFPFLSKLMCKNCPHRYDGKVAVT